MRAALIGCGWIAGFHVSALKRAGVDIPAVCDRDEQKAAQLSARVVGAGVFTDAAAMLAATPVDAVHILTPPTSHAALAISAAEAGAHILVEKPMALSTGEADAMIAAARRHNVALVPHHNYLFKPSVQRARELVASGSIGDVVHVETYYGVSHDLGSTAVSGGAHWAYRLPGGAFTNFLPHVVYLQAALLGTATAVTGVAVAPQGSIDEASELSILLQGESATGVMTISIRAQPYAKYVRVFGTKGIVHADLVGEVTTLHRLRRVPRLVSKALFNLEVIPQIAMGTVLNSAKVVTGAMSDMPDVHAFIAELYAALAAGRQPPSRAEDGRLVVQVMEQVWERLPSLEPRLRPAARRVSRDSLTAVERRLVDDGGIADCVLVTGAAGYLGRRIASALVRCGAQVRGLVRDPPSVPWTLEADAEIIGGNLVDPATLRKAMHNVDLVVHCAAVSTNKAPWVLHQQTNIEGTRAVIEAAQEAGVRRLVHVSSVIVYGLSGSPSRPLPESAASPDNVNRWALYLRSKLGAEEVLRKSSRDGTEVVVIRPGIIYGPGRPPSFGLLQLGSSRITVGRGANHLPYTYVDNVVDGILLALTVQRAAGKVYNLVDEPTVEARFVQMRMAEIAGQPIRLLPIPPALLNILAAALERRHEQKGAGVPPISRFHVASATRNLRYDVSKAKEELGWLPEVELDEGLRRTVFTSAE